MTEVSEEEVLLICDLNIFVMAYIFDSTILLGDKPYTFGKILIHQTVLDELEIWLRSGSKKKKFGELFIKSMIDKCCDLVVEEPVLADVEKTKYFGRIARAEKALSTDQKSSDTSAPDKMYLSIAIKLNANLATQERTLRNISKKAIGEKRLFSFSDMIIDRFKQQSISKDDVLNGFKNLDHYNEHLISGNKQKVLSAINPK
jgi:rRNA-processing protein FCF1